MTVVAVLGGPGAPGATSSALALLLSWPLRPGRRVLLVECDPDGGAILAGALEGRVDAVYGLRNLAVADRRGLLAQALWEQLLDVSPQGNGERLLLPGLTDPAQAPGLAYTWEPLVEALRALDPEGYDVILDLGRSGANGPMAVLARRSDVVAATVRTTLRGLSAVRPRLAALREDLDTNGTGADSLGLLLVAEGPYPDHEVSRQFQLPVLGTLTHAPRTARVLSDGGDTTDRRFIRSELMRTARTAADRIQHHAEGRRRRLGPQTQQPTQPQQIQQAPRTQPAQLPPQPPQQAQPQLQQPYQAPAPRPSMPQQAVPSQQMTHQQMTHPQAPQPGAPFAQPPFGQPPFAAGPVGGRPERPYPPQPQHQQPYPPQAYPQQHQQPGRPQPYPPHQQPVQPSPVPPPLVQPPRPQPGGQFTGEWPIRVESQPQISYAAPYIAPPVVPQPPAPAPFPGQDDGPEDGPGEVHRAR
ncbi:hypothetical protein [Kitasatospora griseola]|uniref:hypothetical protein n=1 Tax=Kitasatospora griseola TaxID=2064 RepID=UPI00166F7B85|nr:hypothetical protein [Kitasatospora griseola]GGQ69682.1 hypothetical protein GCM10010195_26540 [Kitasatospora griseola]